MILIERKIDKNIKRESETKFSQIYYYLYISTLQIVHLINSLISGRCPLVN